MALQNQKSEYIYIDIENLIFIFLVQKHLYAQIIRRIKNENVLYLCRGDYAMLGDMRVSRDESARSLIRQMDLEK